MGKLNRKLSTISTLHFVKLILRLILFVAVLIVYLFRKSSDLSNPPYLLFFVWMLFIIEMIFRFFLQDLKVWVAKSNSKRITYQKQNTLHRKINLGKKLWRLQ